MTVGRIPYKSGNPKEPASNYQDGGQIVSWGGSYWQGHCQSPGAWWYPLPLVVFPFVTNWIKQVKSLSSSFFIVGEDLSFCLHPKKGILFISQTHGTTEASRSDQGSCQGKDGKELTGPQIKSHRPLWTALSYQQNDTKQPMMIDGNGDKASKLMAAATIFFCLYCSKCPMVRTMFWNLRWEPPIPRQSRYSLHHPRLFLATSSWHSQSSTSVVQWIPHATTAPQFAGPNKATNMVMTKAEASCNMFCQEKWDDTQEESRWIVYCHKSWAPPRAWAGQRTKHCPAKRRLLFDTCHCCWCCCCFCMHWSSNNAKDNDDDDDDDVVFFWFQRWLCGCCGILLVTAGAGSIGKEVGKYWCHYACATTSKNASCFHAKLG